VEQEEIAGKGGTRMKIRNTIILIVIAAGLFFYMYRYEIVKVKQREDAEALAAKVMPFEPDSVQVVRVWSGDGEVVCARDGSDWKITEPVQTKGDKSEIDNLISNVTQQSIERKLGDEPQNLSSFGLDKPASMIQLEGHSFESDTLYLGKKNPTGTFAYARLSGDPTVFLLPQVTLSQLDKNLFNLRDKLVLNVEREDVGKFTIKSEKGTITCEKRGDDWYLTEPIEDQADRGSVSRVLSSVSNGKAVGFETEKAEDLSAYGLAKPSVTVDVYTGADNQQHSLSIGKLSDRKYYAKDASRDPIFTVNNVFYESVTQDVKSFRDKKVLDFDRSAVTALEIIEPEETVLCEKDSASTWYVMKAPGPEKVPAKESKVNQLLSTLVALRVEEFADDAPKSLAPYGLEAPWLEIAVKGESGELARVSIGDQKGENYYAHSSGRDRVYLVRGRSVTSLKVNYEDMREEEKKDEGGASTQ
jgi:hypothetical protein